MTVRHPFRAVPIDAGKRYRRKRQIAKHKSAVTYLGIAALMGAAVGAGSGALGRSDLEKVAVAFKGIAVSAGIMRSRAPAEGDYWPGCNQTHLAGSTPIYRGEPGYREGFDGDGDGVACEPYRGR